MPTFNAFEKACRADLEKLHNEVPDRLLNKVTTSSREVQNILSATYGVNSPNDALAVIQRLEDSLKAIQREQATRVKILSDNLLAPDVIGNMTGLKPYQLQYLHSAADLEEAVKTLYGLQNPAAVMPVAPKQKKLLLL